MILSLIQRKVIYLYPLMLRNLNLFVIICKKLAIMVIPWTKLTGSYVVLVPLLKHSPLHNGLFIRHHPISILFLGMKGMSSSCFLFMDIPYLLFPLIVNNSPLEDVNMVLEVVVEVSPVDEGVVVILPTTSCAEPKAIMHPPIRNLPLFNNRLPRKSMLILPGPSNPPLIFLIHLPIGMLTLSYGAYGFFNILFRSCTTIYKP